MFSDPAAHVAKFEGMGHHGVTILDEQRSDDTFDITITRTVDVDGIPGFARRFINPRNTVVSHDHWQDDGDGTYSGRFSIEAKGTPVAISGVTSLEPDGDGTRYRIDVDVTINVPLVGGRLEGFARGIVDRQLREEIRLAEEWLASH